MSDTNMNALANAFGKMSLSKKVSFPPDKKVKVQTFNPHFPLGQNAVETSEENVHNQKKPKSRGTIYYSPGEKEEKWQTGKEYQYGKMGLRHQFKSNADILNIYNTRYIYPELWNKVRGSEYITEGKLLSVRSPGMNPVLWAKNLHSRVQPISASSSSSSSSSSPSSSSPTPSISIPSLPLLPASPPSSEPTSPVSSENENESHSKSSPSSNGFEWGTPNTKTYSWNSVVKKGGRERKTRRNKKTSRKQKKGCRKNSRKMS